MTACDRRADDRQEADRPARRRACGRHGGDGRLRCCTSSVGCCRWRRVLLPMPLGSARLRSSSEPVLHRRPGGLPGLQACRPDRCRSLSPVAYAVGVLAGPAEVSDRPVSAGCPVRALHRHHGGLRRHGVEIATASPAASGNVPPPTSTCGDQRVGRCCKPAKRCGKAKACDRAVLSFRIAVKPSVPHSLSARRFLCKSSPVVCHFGRKS